MTPARAHSRPDPRCTVVANPSIRAIGYALFG